MNLYIKNLDPSIGNTELFELFRKYGRIVSARVMSSPTTGLSKGYGFVSYSKHEEAASALEEMNGQMVLSKPVIVAYHEPKKPRQEKSSSTTTSSFHSPPTTAPPVEFNTVSYFETRHPHENIELDLSFQPKELQPTRKLSFADMPYHRPSISIRRPSAVSGINFHSSLERVPEERVRKGSVESVMTESSAHIQKMKMTEAIRRCGVAGSDIMTITDMLLTLKKRERSLCLFNPDFLKEKINAAMDALEIFEDDLEEPEVVLRRPSLSRKASLPRVSKAIPIVAPDDKVINTLLNSFQGKPLYEKKQLLGDQLFPLVKATGVRHAPKITIRLLDTVELEELARIMFNKELLKVQVNKIA
ncbi:hypothetical protein G6F56_005561 [Rhizopus delemar]|nr:hypothetical protein G6F56_005561 [Rhizopus delemar]